jgi:hypothetical protein
MVSAACSGHLPGGQVKAFSFEHFLPSIFCMVTSPHLPYYLWHDRWRMLPRAVSSERRCPDEQKRTTRTVNT